MNKRIDYFTILISGVIIAGYFLPWFEASVFESEYMVTKIKDFQINKATELINPELSAILDYGRHAIPVLGILTILGEFTGNKKIRNWSMILLAALGLYIFAGFVDRLKSVEEFLKVTIPLNVLMGKGLLMVLLGAMFYILDLMIEAYFRVAKT